MNDEHLNQVLLKLEEGIIFYEGKLSKKDDIWSSYKKMNEIGKDVLRTLWRKEQRQKLCCMF